MTMSYPLPPPTSLPTTSIHDYSDSYLCCLFSDSRLEATRREDEGTQILILALNEKGLTAWLQQIDVNCDLKSPAVASEFLAWHLKIAFLILQMHKLYKVKRAHHPGGF